MKMLKNYPILEKYFRTLDSYVLGDLLVFEKNCREADENDRIHEITISGRKMVGEHPSMRKKYSTIYPLNIGSNPSSAYINNPNPRLTIPIAMMLFSVMELMGIFYTGRTDPKSTTKNLQTFFDKINIEDRPTNEEISILIKIFRHGLIHQYFPKKDYTLSFSLLNPDKLFFTTTENCLNVNYLKELFLKGYNIIKSDTENYVIMEINLNKMNSIL